ncbi:MAG: hypothetical protein GF310_12665, partial [candidate division Zixibacteria bacterium]|nr:hypothetical protein [candidate division Zixibacteria bacterium]
MKFIQDNDAEILKQQFAEYDGDVNFIYFKKDEDCETCGIAHDLLKEVEALSD